jgi:hypothetical protein
MAQNLLQVVSQFKLKTETREEEIKVIDVFKEAHVKWLKRAASMMEGGKRILLEEVVTYKECALGNWYYGRGQKDYAQNEYFKKVEHPHQEFHAVLLDLIKAVGQDEGRAKQLFAQLKQLSGEIEKLLTSLQTTM